MLLFTVSTKEMLEKNYAKELLEIKKLDEMKMQFNYSFYDGIVGIRTETIINNIINNKQLLNNILIKELCMNINEYNDLEKYEKEVIHEEIYDILSYEISELTEF